MAELVQHNAIVDDHEDSDYHEVRQKCFKSLLRINLSFYKRLTTLNQKLKVGKIEMDRSVIANPHAV